MTLLLFAVLAVSAGVGRSEVVAQVPGTVLHVAFEAPGFRDHPAIRAKFLEEAGQSGVIAGAIDPARTTLSVVVVKDEPRRSSAQWRDEFARRAKGGEAGAGAAGARAKANNRGGQGNPAAAKTETTKNEPKTENFQVGGVACRELATTQADEKVNTRFDAYVVSAGLVFDLHVSTWTDAEGEGLSRRDFQKIVESFQVVFVRHGAPRDLPRDARDAMHEALAAWPEWRRGLAPRLARKPDDANLQFVQAELMLLSDAPPEEVVEAHGKVLASLQKLRSTSAEQRFEWMLCEQSIGLSLLRADDAAGAIPHLDKCVEIARQLRSPARPIVLYSLACAQARGGDPVVAIRCLDEAINAEPKLRDAARKEPAFQAISGDKRYQALVRR